MFKPGDAVYLNPKYLNGVDTTRGIISVETAAFDPNRNLIYWEDGKLGHVFLNTVDDYLLLV